VGNGAGRPHAEAIVAELRSLRDEGSLETRPPEIPRGSKSLTKDRSLMLVPAGIRLVLEVALKRK